MKYSNEISSYDVRKFISALKQESNKHIHIEWKEKSDKINP